MNRRQFLAAAGLATPLSGCQSVKSVTRSGPPYFESVTISGPDEVAVRDEFSVDVSVTNTGGRAGDFSATISLSIGGSEFFRDDQSITIEDVGIDETASTTLGPWYKEWNETLVLEMTDHAVRHEIDGAPAKLDRGDRLALREKWAAVERVEFSTGFVSDYYNDGPTVVSPDAGAVFAFVNIEGAGGSGDFATPISPGRFTVRSGSATVSPSDIPDAPSGRAYSVSDGEGDGWLGFEVPRNDVHDLQLAWDAGLSGNAPEGLWDISLDADSELPDFEVVAFEAPESVPVTEEVELSATIVNRGGPGTFEGLVQRTGNVEEVVTTVRHEFEAGESWTWANSYSQDRVGAATFVLEPLGERTTVEITNPEFSVGETFETPANTAITVEQIFARDRGRMQYYDGEQEQATAEDDHQFVFVKVSFKNQYGETVDAPSDFKLEADGKTYESYYPGWTFTRIQIEYPVEGHSWAFGGDGLLPGESYSGWLIFEVPKGVSAYDMVISHTHVQDWGSIEITATWQKDRPNN